MSTQELYQLYLKHSKVVIDSRKVESGNLFFAIKGERFDGNQFAAAALDATRPVEVEELELFSGAMWRFDDGEWDEMGQAHEIANAAISS